MDWSPQENPIVQRAFRTGFRSGPSSFKIGWWVAGLALVTLGPLALRIAMPTVGFDDAMSIMFYGLLILLGLVFLIGGFQRMISSFSKEREQGTFEFLQLSTLRSSQITFGFLLAGQLPGYLAMTLVAPILLIAAYFLEYSYSLLLELMVSFLVLTLTLSVIFLNMGFWTKKASEFRGAAIVYIILYMFLGYVVLNGIMETGLLPGGWRDIILGFPVVLQYLVSLDGESVILKPLFFGFEFRPSALLALVWLPIAAIFLVALNRSLRHRERPPWSSLGASTLYLWISFLFLGMWYRQGVPIELRATGFSLFSYFLLLTILKKCSRTRGETIHDLGRFEGSWRSMLRKQPTSPLRMGWMLSVIYIFSFWGLLLDRGATEPTSAGEFALPFLLLTAVLATGAGYQLLRWRVPSWVGVMAVANLIFSWLGFFVYSNGHSMQVSYVSGESLRTFGSLSPFSQILGVLRGSQSPAGWGGWDVIYFQAFFAIAAGILVWQARSVGIHLASRARALLDSEPGEEVQTEGEAPAT